MSQPNFEEWTDEQRMAWRERLLEVMGTETPPPLIDWLSKCSRPSNMDYGPTFQWSADTEPLIEVDDDDARILHELGISWSEDELLEFD